MSSSPTHNKQSNRKRNNSTNNTYNNNNINNNNNNNNNNRQFVVESPSSARLDSPAPRQRTRATAQNSSNNDRRYYDGSSSAEELYHGPPALPEKSFSPTQNNNYNNHSHSQLINDADDADIADPYYNGGKSKDSNLHYGSQTSVGFSVGSGSYSSQGSLQEAVGQSIPPLPKPHGISVDSLGIAMQPLRQPLRPPPTFFDDDVNSINGGDPKRFLNDSRHISGTVLQLQPVIRKKTVKRLELFYGNLVINCPVPDFLLQKSLFRNEEEFTNMRYSAVTGDPDEFMHRKFTLRPSLYGRSTELFIVMTMYNEDEVLFTRSMSAVMKNIAHLCSRDRSKVWGPDGWKKVVVCVISDGRSKINSRTLKVLGLMGVYQEDIMKNEVNGDPTTMHMFEYTTQVCVDPDLNLVGSSDKKWVVPVQLMFCLKEQNKKKLNSHRWFFNAFAPLLSPNVCVLLDVGTKPTSTSIYHLWKAFDLDPHVAGACGEIVADLGTLCSKVLNPLVAAQNFEYKMSNILDKPMESVFGYISVLPGAFSAYRYRALLNSASGQGPLSSYFMGEKLHEGSANVFASNMFLAEDRILCFELVAKRGYKWVLKYVKAAKAETDVPDGVAEFISQRRRWLNGSFFASVYAMAHWHRLWSTNHNLLQKIWFQVQLLYNVVNTFFTWFGIGMFYLTFYFLSQGMIDAFNLNGTAIGEYLFQIARQLYIFTIVIIFIISLGNRPQGSKGIFVFTMFLFALIMCLMLFLTGWTIYTTVNAEVQRQQAQTPGASGTDVFSKAFISNPSFRNIFISVVATYGVYLIGSLLHGEPFHMFTSFGQYMLLLPSFINILPIYAFCNTHDISWGTKGDNNATLLGGAKKVAGADQVEVELPFLDNKDKTSLNQDYVNWMRELARRTKPEPPKRDLNTKMNDWYRSFRTRLVLVWMFSNAALIVILTEQSVAKLLGDGYLTFIFWSMFVLAFIRMLGSFIYLLGYWGATVTGCRCC